MWFPLIRECVETKGDGGEQIVLWGDESPAREFLYVEDAAEGIVRSTKLYDGSGPVNLGTGKEISIKERARIISSEEVGSRSRISSGLTKSNNQPRRCLDVSGAQQYFGSPLEPA